MFSGTHGERANQNLCYLFLCLPSCCDDKIERKKEVMKDNGGELENSTFQVRHPEAGRPQHLTKRSLKFTYDKKLTVAAATIESLVSIICRIIGIATRFFYHVF